MEVRQETLFLLGVVLFFGLFIPQFFRRFHFPFTTSLILVGSAMGPKGLAYLKPDETLYTFAFLGAAFLMLLAGFEGEVLSVEKRWKPLARLMFWNGLIPGLGGIGLTRLLGYPWAASFFMGGVFLSSSILLVFTLVKSLDLGQTVLGTTLKSLTVYEDLLGTLVVFLVFQTFQPSTRFPIPILLGLLVSSVIILRMFLPEVVTFFFSRTNKDNYEFEEKVRLILALLLLAVFLYSAIGVHPVIGAFLVGFSLSSIPDTDQVREKLYTIGYAAFIPVFLFVVGMETDLSMLLHLGKGNALLAIVVGAIGLKVVGGVLGGTASGFSFRDSAFIGIASSSKLTVSLSASFTALKAGILDGEVFTAIILVSVISSVITPLSLRLLRSGETP